MGRRRLRRSGRWAIPAGGGGYHPGGLFQPGTIRLGWTWLVLKRCGTSLKLQKELISTKRMTKPHDGQLGSSSRQFRQDAWSGERFRGRDDTPEVLPLPIRICSPTLPWAIEGRTEGAEIRLLACEVFAHPFDEGFFGQGSGSKGLHRGGAVGVRGVERPAV